MNLNKFDIKSDGIADIYRSALYLARGAEDVGLSFLKEARKKLGQEIISCPTKLRNRRQKLIFAEKVLDQYLRFKSL